MYTFLTKNGQTLAFGFGILMVLIYFIMILAGQDPGDMTNDMLKGTGKFNFGLWAAILLVALGFILWALFTVFHVFGNLKGSLKGFIGIGILAVILIIFKSMAKVDSGRLLNTVEEANIGPALSSWLSGALNTTVGLIAIAIVILVLFEIYNLFKK